MNMATYREILSVIRMVSIIELRRQKSYIFTLAFVQFLISLIDLVLVFIVGNFINRIIVQDSSQLELLDVNLSSKIIPYILLIVFLVKSVANYWITKLILNYLANASSLIGDYMSNYVINSNSEITSEMPINELTHGTLQGTSAKVIGVISNTIYLLQDIFYVFILLVCLMIYNIQTSVVMLIYVVILSLLTTSLIGKKLHFYSRLSAEHMISTQNTFHDIIRVRDVIVPGQLSKNLIARLSHFRFESNSLLAKQNLTSTVPKYIFDAALIGGVLIFLILDQFGNIYDSKTIAIFVVASTRILPAALKIQSSIANLRVAQSTSKYAVKILDFMHKYEENSRLENRTESNNSLHPAIKLEKLCFTFNNTPAHPIINNVSFEFSGPGIILISGKNGAGKSTLLKLISGQLKPSSGKILLEFGDSTKKNTCAVLPQETHVMAGNLLANLTFYSNNIDYSKANSIIEDCCLTNFLGYEDLSKIKMSGGEKQRLGLARLLYLDSTILLMDEPNNSLDIETKNIFLRIIKDMKRSKMLILISHELAWQTLADTTIYVQ